MDIGKMSIVETSESRWFKVTVFVVSGFFVGFSLANIIYFNRIRTAAAAAGGSAGGVTRGEAVSMLWINAILFAIALVIFLWSIYRLVAGEEYRRQNVERVKQYLNEPGSGFIQPQAPQAPQATTNVVVTPPATRTQTVVAAPTPRRVVRQRTAAAPPR